MTAVETALVLVCAVGSTVGGAVGAILGHRKVAREEADRRVQRHEDFLHAPPTLTPSPANASKE